MSRYLYEIDVYMLGSTQTIMFGSDYELDELKNDNQLLDNEVMEYISQKIHCQTNTLAEV